MVRISGERELPYPADAANRALRWAARADAKFGYVTRDEPDLIQIRTERQRLTIDLTVTELTAQTSLLRWENRNVFGADRWALGDMMDDLVQRATYRIEHVERTEGRGASSGLLSGTLVGGYRTALPLKAALQFSMDETGLYLATRQTSLTISADDLVNVSFGGPGRTTTGGGFVGGGFGPVGFAEGAVLASFLNSLTTRTKVNALVHAVSIDSEYVIHTSAKTPGELALLGSGLTGSIAANRRAVDTRSAVPDIADQIAKLASLRDSGALTDAEFEVAKRRILGTER